MSESVQNLLDSFKELSEAEKHQLVVEILRATKDADMPPLSDDDLVRTAETLFLDLDRSEAQNEHP